MKKNWGFGAVLLSCGLSFSQFACSGGAGESAHVEVGDQKMDELIGSVAVNSKSLDGIGAIGFVYNYDSGNGGFGGNSGDLGPLGNAGFQAVPVSAGSAGLDVGRAGAGGDGGQAPFYAQCTGTLISKNSVLTSRSCGQLFQQVYDFSTLKFAIGSDPSQPKRLVDVVDVEFAPAVVQAGGLSYPDIAVLHLGESITDVAVFPVAALTDDLIGKPLAAVGYGNSDLRYQSGTRRAGAVTLRGTSGPLYPLIFGSFDAYYAFSLDGGYVPSYPGYGYATSGGASSVPPTPAPIVAGGFGVAGGASAGSSNAGAGGGQDDWYRQYLQQQYDTTLLGSGEAYFGGTDSDAQPCGADQGGPAVRKLQGQVRVFGVFSRTPFGGCEKGALYAAITGTTKAFIDGAAQWKDPCAALTVAGKCAGTTATRCSTVAEGKRRAVKLDCALLNQVCVVGADAQVACSDK